MDEFTEAFGSLFGLAIGLVIFVLLICIAVGIYNAIVTGKLYKKAGQPAWAAWIPGYTTWVRCKAAGCHWLLFAIIIGASVLELFVGEIAVLSDLFYLLSLAAGFFINWNMAKKFGKGVGFAIGFTIIPIVFISIIAFSKNTKYLPEAEVKNCAFFDVNF